MVKIGKLNAENGSSFKLYNWISLTQNWKDYEFFSCYSKFFINCQNIGIPMLDIKTN